MGMFTRLFQKSHDPYDLKGRWYKVDYDPSGDSFNGDFKSNDIGVLTASTSTAFVLPSGYVVMDFIAIPKGHFSGTSATGGTELTRVIASLPDGRMGIRFPNSLNTLKTNYPDGFIWYFYAVKG